MANDTITIDQLEDNTSFTTEDLFYTRSPLGIDTKATASQVKDFVRPEDASETTGGLLTATVQSIAGNKKFIDGVKTTTLEATGGTELKGGATITGNLTISGDLVINGDAKKIEAQTLNVKDNMIITREGATQSLSVGEVTGIKAMNYDGATNGLLAFDKNGIARVGDEGDLQPLATRVENPTNGSIAVWNENLKRYEPIPQGSDGDLLESKGEGLAPQFTTHPKVNIKSITQTTTSIENSGVNVVTCELTNGVKSNFEIRNGTFVLSSLIDVLYPVGYVYISTVDTDPSTLWGGTWERIASGRVLQGADDTHEGGTTIEAGLPNIKGYFGVCGLTNWIPNNGAFKKKVALEDGAFYSSAIEKRSDWGFSAVDGECKTDGKYKTESDYKVYGKSDTVQPPAFVVYMWKRVA